MINVGYAGAERGRPRHPLGHEVDRALAPFDRQRPARAYLLTLLETNLYDPGLHAKQRTFTERVASDLEARGIQVVPVQTDLLTFST